MLPRRALLASFLALAAGRPVAATPYVGGNPLPAFSDLLSALPLPYSPAAAWRSLPADVQAEIGAAVIAQALADYISGEMHGEADHFHDDALRERCIDVRDDLTGKIPARLWELFPDLYGPDGDHPAWALNNGFAR